MESKALGGKEVVRVVVKDKLKLTNSDGEDGEDGEDGQDGQYGRGGSRNQYDDSSNDSNDDDDGTCVYQSSYYTL